MAKPELGTKRVCQSCGARFYDLGREPAPCPKCGFENSLEALLRSKRSRSPAAEPKVRPVAKRAVVDETEEDDIDLEVEDDDESIEDASELGEDEDVADVLENADDDTDNEDR